MYMQQSIFESNYSKYVEPLYGPKRNESLDVELTQHIMKPHSYSISFEEREDFTNIDVYSIDPEGCEDADDAFSIYYINNALFLAIHIADPTEYIEIHSELYRSIEKYTTTKYLSNRKPIHMMPDQILKLASLKGNNELKKTISIVSEIDVNTYLPKREIRLLFAKIMANSDHALSYKEASQKKDLDILSIGLKISESLQKQRGKYTKGIKLNELSNSYVKYDNNYAYLYTDSNEEKAMKQMIAEFAIFANSFVGEYLKKTLNTGIFRTCEAKDWLNSVNSNITGEEMIQQIIVNGITADYLSKASSHDLVGMPEYSHFTSPIRRLADCICHYLLKYIYLSNKRPKDYVIPFLNTDLERLSFQCLNATKKDKKNQYLDIKFRLLQVMYNMILERSTINLEYYITGYSGLFLNIIICKIEEFNVHMSYTLRIPNYSKPISKEQHYQLLCTKVNCFVKYDQGCIPELDEHVLQV